MTDAFLIEQPGASSFAQIEEPRPGPGDVLLRVRRLGFCGSDLNTFRGLNPLVSFPRIPGHEIAATIEAAGADVPDDLHPGLDVTISPYTSCGACSSCRQGRVNACRDNQTLGVQRDGAFTGFLTVPWQKVFWHDGLGLRELALVEPLTVGFHAAARGRVAAGETVAVLGCGAIGLGAIAGAAARGARVVAVDLDAGKLAIAEAAGASEVVDVHEHDLHERLQALTDGDGPSVVIEAVGSPQTFRAAVEEVAFGGRVVYIGYASEEVAYDTSLFVKKELDILGSRNALAADFEAVMEVLAAGRFPAEQVVTTTVPFAEASHILQAWSDAPQAFTKIHVEGP